MGAVRQTSQSQFEVRFAGLGGLVQRVLGSRPQGVDPYLIAKAIAEVMSTCAIRSASGKRLLWNEYRVILAQPDFAQLWSLEAYLQRDLREVLTGEAKRLDAELVGDLCIHVVADEGAELEPGLAVVRVKFAPTAELSPPQRGEMTVRLGAVAGVIHGNQKQQGTQEGVEHTVGVSDAVEVDPSLAVYRLDWPGGSAHLALGPRVVLGRPHPGHPRDFVALTGAGTKINKQQAWVIAMNSRVVVGRLPGANPVHVDGKPLSSGTEIEVAKPTVEVSLSHGELVVHLHCIATYADG